MKQRKSKGSSTTKGSKGKDQPKDTKKEEGYQKMEEEKVVIPQYTRMQMVNPANFMNYVYCEYKDYLVEKKKLEEYDKIEKDKEEERRAMYG